MTDRQKRVAAWRQKIDVCVSQYQSLDKAMTAAISVGCMDINGPLHQAVWQAFETMMRMVDFHEWISWHIFDNDCGTKKHAAYIDKRKFIVRNSLDLARLIVYHEDHLTSPTR